MTGAAPRDCERLHREIAQRPAVFDPKGVVGVGQQGGIRWGKQGGHGPLAGGGKAVPLGQFCLQSRLKGIALQRPCGSQKSGAVSAFAAESQHVQQPRGGENLDAALGESLGRTDGPGEGQLQYQIRPAPDGGLRPGVTAYQRKVTSLDKIAAHGANNGGVSAKLLPDGLYQGEVTIVQGIIFCYDTSGFHICHLKAVTK